MEKIKITAIVRTKNSEDTLCDTLESLSFLDEIIALDEHSTDDTTALLKEYKAKIIYLNKNEFTAGFNSAIAEAKNDTVIFVEDDEIIPKKLLDEINDYILKEDKKKRPCISLDQKTFYLGKELKCARKKGVLRVFKKNSAHPEDDFSNIFKPEKAKVHKLKSKNQILKYNKKGAVRLNTFLIEKNGYSVKFSKRKKACVFFQPLFCFIYFYFFKAAILDGARGLVYALQKAWEKYIFELMLFERDKNDI